MKRTPKGKQTGVNGADARSQKQKTSDVALQRVKPIQDAPFAVDVSNDGDIATPKRDLSEDEVKEQEERKP